MTKCALLNLNGDLLRLTAGWLNPRDRFSLALACKRLHDETWSTFAEEDLTSRFSFESRFEFDLDVQFQPVRYASSDAGAARKSKRRASRQPAVEGLRLIPERSQMQHCYLSVSSCGRQVAVLAYDNILRVVNPRAKRVLAAVDVGPVCGADVWDTRSGRRASREENQSATHSYEEENGVDVEVGFGFTQDSRQVFVSSRRTLVVYDVGANVAELAPRHSLDVRGALNFIDQDDCVGGSCSISPDGSTAAWVVFADSPAVAYASIWDLESGVCTCVCELAKIHRRRWSALGWARVQFSPNGRYLISVANNAKKMVRTVRIDDSFHRVKLSEYAFAVFDLLPSSRRGELTPLRSHLAWLELSPDVYPKEIASFLSALVDGLALNEQARHNRPLTCMQEMRLPSLHLNALHSCPSEATYKALSFGPQTRHPWFVTKQPMCSVHIGRHGDRAMISAVPHGNDIYRVVRGPDGETTRRRLLTETSGLAARSKYAFKGMPWRAGFASSSAFSATGKWLAGATLVDDRCVVCVRNVTHDEYFGLPDGGGKQPDG
jgi:hypothetical protein